MATNPMEQFEVHKIGPEIEISGINLSFTNSSLFMVISAVLISILLLSNPAFTAVCFSPSEIVMVRLLFLTKRG